MKEIDKILAWTAKIAAAISAIAVAWAALFYVAEVVGRYGFNHPLNWSGDNGSYMLCVIAIMALPILTRRRKHIAVTIIVDLFPERQRQVAMRVLDFATAALLLGVSWFVIELCIRQYFQGTLTTQANQIPRWWLTAIMSLGLVLSAINFIFPADTSETIEIEEF